MIREVIDLVERYIDNSSAEKEWVLASKAFMPMTPSILKEFERKVDTAYHITDEKGLVTLKKIQNSKKTISAFTVGSEGIAVGAHAEGLFLVELEGYSTFDAKGDFYSALSRNGYKWLRPLMSDKEMVVNNYFSVPMNKKMVEYFGVKDRHSIPSTVQKLDGKGKAKFIKWYFDESKKLINKKLLDKLKKSIASDIHPVFNNDELFLHKFKVKEVEIVEKSNAREEDYERRKDLIQKLGFSFNGFIEEMEVARLGNW